MTHTTPEMARELAEVCAHEYVSNPDAPNALRSLADQLEALKAEQAVLVTRWKANEDVQEIIIKELTAERDAYKAELENIANANPRKWDAPCNNAETFLLWAQNRARAAIAKEAK